MATGGGRAHLAEWLKSSNDDDLDAPVKSCRGSVIQLHHVCGQIRLDDEFWPPEPDPDHEETAADIEILVNRSALSVLVPK